MIDIPYLIVLNQVTALGIMINVPFFEGVLFYYCQVSGIYSAVSGLFVRLACLQPVECDNIAGWSGQLSNATLTPPPTNNLY